MNIYLITFHKTISPDFKHEVINHFITASSEKIAKETFVKAFQIRQEHSVFIEKINEA